MVPAGNALGVLSSPPQADHPPLLNISEIKKRRDFSGARQYNLVCRRCNAVDGTFYDAINDKRRVLVWVKI